MKRGFIGLALLPLVAHAGLVVEEEKAPATGLIVPAADVTVAPPAKVIVPVETWVGAEGSTLKTTLEQWAKKAGWKLVWDAYKDDRIVDYGIDARLTFEGTIDQAISQWLPLYEHAPIPLAVDFQPSQHLIYITKRSQ